MSLRRVAAATLVFAVGACAHYPHTKPLAPEEVAGRRATGNYRFENFPPAGRNSDSIFVILTFSGGGTRAAAFAYGALLELARTKIDTGAQSRSLLDEVDVISTVSGGSFAGAYYALFGADSLQSFEKRFLDWNAQSALTHKLFTPALFRLLSPNFSRSDMAAEVWDARLFHGATFNDLVARHTRPYLIINATDISLGSPFSFTQEQFDPMCDDVSKFPIARAVAASSAFPGLLTPITVENHAGHCAFTAPVWATSDSADAVLNPDAYRAARDYLAYTDPSMRTYIHLMDGGPSDNLGIRPVLRGLTSIARDFSLLRLQGNNRLRRIIVITVNARTEDLSIINRDPNPPGEFGVLVAAAGVPFDNYSNESLTRLTMLADERRAERMSAECYNRLLAKIDSAKPSPRIDALVPIDIVHITFQNVKDPAARTFFLRLPTSFSLPPSTVARVRDVAGELLRDNEVFQNLLRALRYQDKPEALSCLYDRLQRR